MELQKQEIAAINDYNYEQAELIYQAQCVEKSENFENTKNDYQVEIERKMALHDSECQNQVAQSNQELEELIDELNEKKKNDFNKIVARQKKELESAKQKWVEAHNAAQRTINQKIESKLKSSQEFAKVHNYKEAIKLRDIAFSMKDNKELPELKEVDNFYSKLFEAMLRRHKEELNERESLYQADLALLNDACENKNICTELDKEVQNSRLASTLMKGAIDTSKESHTATNLIKMLSPRSKKSPSSRPSSRSSRTSRSSSGSRSSIHNIPPRSPNRMGQRN